jgi:hypothetical protein
MSPGAASDLYPLPWGGPSLDNYCFTLPYDILSIQYDYLPPPYDRPSLRRLLGIALAPYLDSRSKKVYFKDGRQRPFFFHSYSHLSI